MHSPVLAWNGTIQAPSFKPQKYTQKKKHRPSHEWKSRFLALYFSKLATQGHPRRWVFGIPLHDCWAWQSWGGYPAVKEKIVFGDIAPFHQQSPSPIPSRWQRDGQWRAVALAYTNHLQKHVFEHINWTCSKFLLSPPTLRVPQDSLWISTDVLGDPLRCATACINLGRTKISSGWHALLVATEPSNTISGLLTGIPCRVASIFWLLARIFRPLRECERGQSMGFRR